MARKRKAADEKPASAPQSSGSASKSTGKKARIDWSKVDDLNFTVKSVTVKTPKDSNTPAAKKQKTSANGTSSRHSGQDASLVDRPFPEAEFSEVQLKIEPAVYWEATSRYRKFTLEDSMFQLGQMIFVKREGEEDGIARILEIRGGDAAHVYLRVCWTYEPEDLSGGRQPYHGSHELLASNHMEIIDARAVQDPADVVYFDDDPESSTTLEEGQYFWRQSLDVNKPKGMQLSKMNTYCVDEKPYNPDEGVVQCPKCSLWLHTRCLQDQAVRDVYEEDKAQTPKKKGRPSKAGKAGDDLAAQSAFAAQYITSDDGKGRITITDKRKGKKKRHWDVDIYCLACKELIEKVHDDEEEVKDEEPGTDNIDTDQQVEMTDVPTNGTAPSEHKPAPAEPKMPPRSRGRPLGSTKKKRKRASTTPGTSKQSSAPSTKYLKTEDGKEPPVVSNSANEPELKTEDPDVFEVIAEQVTPAPAPMDESVFRSGVRSVRRLLWGSEK